MKLAVVLLVFLGIAFALPLAPDAETAITDAHNSARADVVPAAEVPIPDISYDSTIEATAAAYADLCNYQHSTGNSFGENLYASGGDQSGDIPALMNAAATLWEAEEADYILTENGDSCNNVCGHYTQMVWADTTDLGCGYAVCTQNSPFGSSFPTWTIVVCNYSPAGNVEGEIPYVPSDGCDVPTECANLGFECGDANICSSTFDCGSCDTGFECNNNVCEQITGPCATCGENTQCINDQCVCLPGFVENGGFCELANPDAPNVNDQFTQTLPLEEANFIQQDIPTGGVQLELIQSGEHILRWDRATPFVDLDSTYVTAMVHQTDGSLSIGAFHGQPDNENDMLEWVITDISGGIAGLKICIGRYGSRHCSNFAPISFSDEVHLIAMEISVSGGTISTNFQIDDSYIWYSTTDLEYFPNAGSVAFNFNPEDDTPTISQVTLSTQSDFQVDLFGCLDTAEWQTVYNTYYSSGTAPSRVNGQNGCCNCNV